MAQLQELANALKQKRFSSKKRARVGEEAGTGVTGKGWTCMPRTFLAPPKQITTVSFMFSSSLEL
jgi:hypothetical protein